MLKYWRMRELLNLPFEYICRNCLQVEQCICYLVNSLLSPQVWLDEWHRVHLAFQVMLLCHSIDSRQRVVYNILPM